MKKIDLTIGIDIGGTNTAFGIIDREGKFYGDGNIQTNEHQNISDYITELCTEIKISLSKIKKEVNLVGIGLGAPNGNFYSGCIERASNLRWKGIIPLCDLIKHHFPDSKVIMTNDANAAALGEMIYGGAKDIKDFIMITLGTGVGSGFVSGGNLIYGHDGFAGEIGHVIIVPDGRECGCGRKGCLETYTSATGVVRTAYEMMSTYNDASSLREIPYSKMESKTIYKAALKGDKIALRTFDYTAKILGIALANTVAITSPKAIFLMGGLAKSGDLLIKPTKKYMEKYMLYTYENKVEILPSQLTKNVAIYGAASLIWNDIQN